ncbi:MAG: hypothetical protein EHM91_04840, partial [Planctomycetota bacterium]
MNCAFDKEKLSGYYDGELDAAEKAEVERHIASCSECLRELGELKSAAILVKELPRLRAPRSIADGVRKDIQAAGKVHSFARVRRTVMWAASAAAVLFIGLNVIYFSTPAPEGSVVARTPVSAAPALGRALPSEEAPLAEPARRAAPEEQSQKLRADEARKNEAAERDRKTPEAPAPTAKSEVEREKAPAAKVEEKKATAAPADPAARPAPPAEAAKPAPTKPAAAPPPAPAAPVTAIPAPRPEPKPAEPPADKAAPTVKKDGDAQAGLKQKAAEAGPAADPGPTHLTLATTQLAKSRPEMAEALKRMG